MLFIPPLWAPQTCRNYSICHFVSWRDQSIWWTGHTGTHPCTNSHKSIKNKLPFPVHLWPHYCIPSSIILAVINLLSIHLDASFVPLSTQCWLEICVKIIHWVLFSELSLGTAALLFMPHPGSLLLPFSKLCQTLFDADPFPLKVRFLLFQGSRIQNLSPSAFSCFL